MYFVFTIELNLLLPCFGQCTCAYTETVDPARRPSIPQVRQGSVRFNSSEEEPPPPLFPSCCILILWYWHCYCLRFLEPKTCWGKYIYCISKNALVLVILKQSVFKSVCSLDTLRNHRQFSLLQTPILVLFSYCGLFPNAPHWNGKLNIGKSVYNGFV